MWRYLARLVPFALLLASCSPNTGSPPATGVSVPNDGVAGEADEPSPSNVLAVLAGVDAELTDALAPYDHASAVATQLATDHLLHESSGRLAECMAADGFTAMLEEWKASSLPNRDDPMLMMHLAFPHIEHLERSGFPTLPGLEISPDDLVERSEEFRESARRCSDLREQDPAFIAYRHFGSIHGAWWQGPLAELELEPRIETLIEEFSVCVRDWGVPPAFAGSELSFLSYVDSLLLADTAPGYDAHAINERMGKLYVECGRDLFEERIRLRSGERREMFLREHEASIRELVGMLESLG